MIYTLIFQEIFSKLVRQWGVKYHWIAEERKLANLFYRFTEAKWPVLCYCLNVSSWRAREIDCRMKLFVIEMSHNIYY